MQPVNGALIIAEFSQQKLNQPELSRREIEVLKLLCDGLSSKEIGMHLGISPKTVEFHRDRLRKKLRLDSSARLIRWAIRNGLIEP